MKDLKIRFETLTKEKAKKYIHHLTMMLNQIPLVDYSDVDVLAEKKSEGRILHNKWDHSLLAFEDGHKMPIGLIIGYEREAEGNEQYPHNSFYISELAVAKDFQKRGLGGKLVNEFLTQTAISGFRSLEGDIRYSVQTNCAEWNNHVRALYESFGFKKRSIKKYDNRTDVVLGYTPN